jgi:MFS family permease
MLAVLTLIGLVPCSLLLVAESFPALLVTAVVIGLSLAVVAPVYIALLADRFGLAAFGTVRGLIVPVMSVMGALSVRFIGEIYDRTGDYHLGLWIYVFIDIAAAALILATYRMHSPKTA